MAKAKPKAVKSIVLKCDRLAVRIVNIVHSRLRNHRLYAYDGIEAAREIRALLIKNFKAPAKPRPRKRT